MTDPQYSEKERLPNDAREYLADRLDGARDLYLLALALGVRGDRATLFGRMIREARIHFTAVIEECRIAGLDTSAIAVMLGKMNESWSTASGPRSGNIWSNSSPSGRGVAQGECSRPPRRPGYQLSMYRTPSCIRHTSRVLTTFRNDCEINLPPVVASRYVAAPLRSSPA